MGGSGAAVGAGAAAIALGCVLAGLLSGLLLKVRQPGFAAGIGSGAAGSGGASIA